MRISKKSLQLLLISLITLLGFITFSLVAVYYYRLPPPPPPYAFASDREGQGDIFVVDAQEQLHNLTQGAGNEWSPTWSADGHALAFTSQRTGDSEIWFYRHINLDNLDKPQNLTQNPAWDYSPTWSPSGQSLAFVSERDGDAEIFMQHLQENEAIQLTFNEETDRLPAWSPDGKSIAFAAIRNGVEQIHRIRPDGTDEQIVTPSPLKGTSPAWSPDSQQLAFIGWDDIGAPGIYMLSITDTNVHKIYASPSRLNSLNWSADGQWFTFTAWDDGNHDLFALPIDGGQPTRLTHETAWDDFMAINPQVPFTPQAVVTGIAQAAPAPRPPANPHLAMGVNIADLSQAYLINDLGFDWAKSFVNWATVEPERGKLNWNDPDNIVKAFGDQKLKILMRVHGTPVWARPNDTMFTHPPYDLHDYETFITALATRYKGQVAAYEIGNEPNLNYEWGYKTPDPASYTAMLKVAYQAIKRVDPQATVVSGGLATTGDGSATATGDLIYLQGMYTAGAKGYFDVLGSHPYSYGHAPDEVDQYGLSLSRVAEQYAVMQANGDAATPIWITELGWVLHSPWDLDEHQASGVSAAQQAEYLVRSYQKVQAEWPFVQGIFIFNLDFSTVPWYPAREPMRWYAILNPDGTPRPAYSQLRQMQRGQ